MRFQGYVSRIGPYARYVFIGYADESGMVLEAWASRKSVIPDVIGRINLPLGALVSFALAPDPRGRGKIAVEIKDESEALSLIDPTTHREFGTIHDLQRTDTSGRVYGLIKRGEEDGADLIQFRASAIVSDGADTTQIGDVLEYGIATHTNQDGGISYNAIDIHTCIPEDVAQKQQQQDRGLYSPADMKLSIRELISRK
jgi:hypothetical protein